MAIRLRCPCGKTLRAPENAAGRKGRCPVCGKVFTIPAMPADAPRAPDQTETGRAAEAPQEADSGPKRKILIADDNVDIRTTLAPLLDARGYNVVVATNGREAVELAQAETPDLILLDVEMPKLSGFQVVRAIRDPLNKSNESCWRTPIIMVTAEKEKRDKQYAASGGADGYVEKPFNPASLFTEINRLLPRI